jgi:hypothetical protein
MTTADSWTTTLEAATEAHHGWDVFADSIIVEHLGGPDPVWVCVDGSVAAVGANGEDVVLPGEVAVFSNQQPKQDHVTTAAGSTSQQLTTPASGSLTYVSVISSGTPQIVVSVQ